MGFIHLPTFVSLVYLSFPLSLFLLTPIRSFSPHLPFSSLLLNNTHYQSIHASMHHPHITSFSHIPFQTNTPIKEILFRFLRLLQLLRSSHVFRINLNLRSIQRRVLVRLQQLHNAVLQQLAQIARGFRDIHYIQSPFFFLSYKYQSSESLPITESDTGSKSRPHHPIPIRGSPFPPLRAVCSPECCLDGSALRSGTASSPCGAARCGDRSPASRWGSCILLNTMSNTIRTCMLGVELSTTSSERLGVKRSTDSSFWNSTPRLRSVR